MSFVTSNMGLITWDQGADPYDHAQLASNWIAVDTHDHSTGRGRQVPSAGIVDAAITSAKIADGAVIPTKIPDASITQAKLAVNSVGSAQIIDGSVGAPEILDGSVGVAELDPNIVPLGTVIAWYRPNTGVSLPGGGWEVCDGRAWNTVSNAWGVSAGFMPDLRNKFILGAALTNIGTGFTQNPDIGMAGGTHSNDLTHGHTVNAHSHTVNAHSHVITADGNHFHYYGSDNGSLTPPANPVGPTVQSIANRGNDNYQTAAAVAEAFAYKNHNHYGNTSLTPDHTHGGSTGNATPGTDSQSPGTNSQLGIQDNRPAYVGLLYIMRVR
jgi:hypothetical protein